MSDPVDPKLAREAQELGAANEEAVEVRNRPLDQQRLRREQLREAWRAENRDAMDAWNRWIEINGIPFDDLRPW